ncbi:MAG: ABC transporter ATP-binding protein [Chloroflexota bacterium]
MQPLLELRNLKTYFYTENGVVHAVNDISYQLNEGESLGVVGESGSGKSVHALSILRLVPSPPGKIVEGEIIFKGQDLLKLSNEEMRRVRGGEIAMIFQDPMSSLNPVLTIGEQINESIMLHLGFSKEQATNRTAELLDLVGIVDPKKRLDDFPHQFSGGMRQRVMIAMALSSNPQLLIADEPTTALDVTIQAQIIELVANLKEKLGMALIWITHDLGVVAGISDTIQVMYGGQIVERGPVRSVFKDTRNAYTLGLLNSLPRVDQASGTRLTAIEGVPPEMLQEPVGDPFAPRNPYATERCYTETPILKPVDNGDPKHLVAAWYDLREVAADELKRRREMKFDG